MLLSATYIGTVWIIATLVISQSVETAFIRGCTRDQEGTEHGSVMIIRCGEQMIQIEGVFVFQANADENCLQINLQRLSPYTCENITNAVQQECHQQNNCQYVLTYPEQEYCPEQVYLPDQPIILRINFECVPPLTVIPDNGHDETTSAALTTMSNDADDENNDRAITPAAQTDGDKTGTVAGAVFGGFLLGILTTVIVVLAFVFLRRKRSQAKSGSPGKTVATGNNVGAAMTQSAVYEYSKGFGGSAVLGNTNDGLYMDIQDASLDGQGNSGQVTESDVAPRIGNPTYDNYVVNEAPTVNSQPQVYDKSKGFDGSVVEGDTDTTLDGTVNSGQVTDSDESPPDKNQLTTTLDNNDKNDSSTYEIVGKLPM